MSSLLASAASQTPRRVSAQPSLRAGDDQFSLAPGVHALGGRAPDAVPLAALQSQPRAATLIVSDEGVTVLQRTTASVVVRVDGEPIGIAPIELRGGTRIEFGECRVWFETEAPSALSVVTVPTVSVIVPRSPADRAGLEVGDVILQVGERVVLTRDEVREALADASLEMPLRLTLGRGANRLSVTLRPPGGA